MTNFPRTLLVLKIRKVTMGAATYLYSQSIENQKIYCSIIPKIIGLQQNLWISDINTEILYTFATVVRVTIQIMPLGCLMDKAVAFLSWAQCAFYVR